MPDAIVLEGRLKNRIDTIESWNRLNPLLLSGEMGIEFITGHFKIGDGYHRWNDLPYQSSVEILKTDPTPESTHKEALSAAALYNILGGNRNDLLTTNKDLFGAINELKLSNPFHEVEGFIYDTGTFDPNFFGSNRVGDITYSKRVGIYVRLGKIIAVIIHAILSYTSSTGPTGSIRLDGFPVIPDIADSQTGLSITTSLINSMTLAVTTPSYTSFKFTGSNGSLSDLTWSGGGTNVEFVLSGIYGVN